MKPIISYKIESANAVHVRIAVFNRGASAGILTVNTEDADRICAFLDVISENGVKVVLYEMRERKWSLDTLSERSGIALGDLLTLLSGSGKPDGMCHGLARAFGTSEEFWRRIL